MTSETLQDLAAGIVLLGWAVARQWEHLQEADAPGPTWDADTAAFDVLADRVMTALAAVADNVRRHRRLCAPTVPLSPAEALTQAQDRITAAADRVLGLQAAYEELEL